MQNHQAAPLKGDTALQGLIIAGAQVSQASGNLSEILSEWHATRGYLWLDVTGRDPAVLKELERAFPVDTRALLEILDPHYKAHVEESDEYFFVQLPIPDEGSAEGSTNRRFVTEELNVICGQRFILTMHAQPQATLRDLWGRYAKTSPGKWAGRWPDSLLYHICDAVLTAFYPHLEWLEDQHDLLERLIFTTNRSQIERIVRFKRHLHGIRRVITPVRDAMASLARRDFALLDPQHRYLFDNLYARSVRLIELVENQRSLFDGLLNADLSLQNTRMNVVMKTLTVVATIMMPLTVLTGFFGMNFEHIPGLHSRAAFWVTTAGMAAIAVGLFAIFKRRGWW